MLIMAADGAMVWVMQLNPLRPDKLFFEFVVGTCIKRLLLEATEQN
jgi:hypothetical protein